MANQSAKKNQQSTRPMANILWYVMYPLIGWFLISHIYFLINDQISIFRMLICILMSFITHLCLKQTIKCWELQLPAEAAEYYIDGLVLNGLVHLLSPFTGYAWYLYWLIVLYIAWIALRWLWDYITPKYEQVDEDEQSKDKRQKKEKKKEKIKYIKG